MKERGMLFKGEMVRAILDDRKRMTRRLVKPQPVSPNYIQPMFGVSPDGVAFGEKWLWREAGPDYPDDKEDDRRGPYGNPGDRIWVKETYLTRNNGESVIYRADLDPIEAAGVGAMYGGWKSSMFMPRKRSRITLDITDLRVDRLQDISEEDAKAEGVNNVMPFLWRRDEWQNKTPNIARYAGLWEAINGSGSWAKNDWVWVYSFRRVTN